MEPTTDAYVLSVGPYEAEVFIGCLESEHRAPQKVSFSLSIGFPSEPKACTTDRIEDAVSYDTLCKELRRVAESKKFHLIEHLAKECVSALTPFVPSGGWLHLTVHKLTPPIAHLKGGARFEIKVETPS